MWQKTGEFVYQKRFFLIILLAIATAWMGWNAKDVKLGYEFTRAIPTDNIKYKSYQEFRKKFGEDGNLMVAGIQTDSFFTPQVFNEYVLLQKKLKAIPGVEDVTSVTNSVNLKSDEENGKITSYRIFPDSIKTGGEIKVQKEQFEGLPFYKYLLYNPDSKAFLCGIRINGDTLITKSRENVINQIVKTLDAFEKKTNITVHKSGLPLIRTAMSVRIQEEMRFFLLGSILLAAIILLLFFRSFSAMLLSLLVVAIGVVFSLGTLQLFGFKISLLTALIPPLIVVIGIPNCIYFLNKYHSAWQEKANKKDAIVAMISKMGVVTLFCNITAAIGFAVFAFTKSAILKEFGLVAGINIFGLFFISLILIPFLLSFMSTPKPHQLKYLHNKYITAMLSRMENWVVEHPKFTLSGTFLVLLISGMGLFKLKSEGYIVDDLPKNDKIYTDLKFFEKHFKGVMPLEITIKIPKEKEKLGDKAWRQFVHKILEKTAILEDSLFTDENFGKPTSLVDGLQFVYRARTGNDTLTNLDKEAWGLIKSGLLQQGLESPDSSQNKTDSTKNSGLSRILKSFIDSSKHEIRISVPMADVGTLKLNSLLKKVETQINSILDSSKTIYISNLENLPDSTKFKVELTGSTVTFLEGSNYIIKGLKDSILYAFILIAFSMMFLFRSLRILLCSLIPNVIPLIITAGVMGWAGVALKPSTVLVFSMALGIAIDITIRFLVNYKQELPLHQGNVKATVSATIKQTGLSIIYTSLVLIAGFVIFIFSGFGGTKALGWLTTLTLFAATITNLLLLPVLLLIGKRKN
jgi:predicted RND superfamily exporter protein